MKAQSLSLLWVEMNHGSWQLSNKIFCAAWFVLSFLGSILWKSK